MDKIITVTLTGGIKDTVAIPQNSSDNDITHILNIKFGELGWWSWT